VRLDRVDVALLRERPGACGWLTSAAGSFSSRKPGKAGDCGTPRWLRASGRTAWRMALRRALTSGRYTLYSRAVINAGYPEARFSRADRNRIPFRIR
jgi:hypothetical protein